MVISLLFSSVLQASRNWLSEACSSNYVNDSALFPDSWDGKGLEGGKFLSKCLSQAHSTQGVSLLTLSHALLCCNIKIVWVTFNTLLMCHVLFAILTGNDSVKLTLASS